MPADMKELIAEISKYMKEPYARKILALLKIMSVVMQSGSIKKH